MMRLTRRSIRTVMVIAGFGALCIAFMVMKRDVVQRTEAQVSPAPTATPSPAFDQAAALAKLREQIKGREQEPAEKVFKNVQMTSMKAMPAARLLAVMQLGYARSLGVNCTHCHVPDKWELEDKTQKQTARDMSAMAARINNELLKGIKNLKSESPVINCTTCHRGAVKPALDLVPR